MFHFPTSHNSSTLTGDKLLIEVFIEHLNVSVQFSAVSREKFRSAVFFNTTFKNLKLSAVILLDILKAFCHL